MHNIENTHLNLQQTYIKSVTNRINYIKHMMMIDSIRRPFQQGPVLNDTFILPNIERLPPRRIHGMAQSFPHNEFQPSLRAETIQLKTLKPSKFYSVSQQPKLNKIIRTQQSPQNNKIKFSKKHLSFSVETNKQQPHFKVSRWSVCEQESSSDF